MRRQGIELVDEVEFTSAIRDLSAESFIRMLAERLNPKIIVAGFNYTFGKKKQGNSETLQRLCQKYGIKTAIIQPVLLGREPVSSTRVRNMITCGNVQDAQLLLGRAYALDGIIVQNKRIGRTIGYPTANIEPDSARVIPADGGVCEHGTRQRRHNACLHEHRNEPDCRRNKTHDRNAYF